jgi:hypothetical protein
MYRKNEFNGTFPRHLPPRYFFICCLRTSCKTTLNPYIFASYLSFGTLDVNE